MIYILMGVSGSGKTLIGTKLAKRLNLPFYDGDDFHPAANVEKMESGEPLNDNDRRPWLEKLRNEMQTWQQEGGAVLACSALKKKYRDILTAGNSLPVQFIYLKGTKELIAQRLSRREGHFMPEKLLDSQFRALEEPKRGEETIHVSINQQPKNIVDEIISGLEL